MADTKLIFIPKDDAVSYAEIRRNSRFIARYIHAHNSHELCFVPSQTSFQAYSGGNRWDVQGPALLFHRAGSFHELLSIGEGEDYESRVVNFFTEALPDPTVTLPPYDCSILPLSEDSAKAFSNYFSLIVSEPASRQAIIVMLILNKLQEEHTKIIGSNGTESYIFSILQDISSHPEEHVTIDRLAATYHVSPSKLKQDFTAVTGMPVRRYISHQQLQLACRLLTQKELALTQIAYQCGFCSQSHFIAAFRGQFGITPGQYRREQNGHV